MLGACTRWQVASSPAAALTGRGHRVVRVTTAQGARLELRDPEVSRDSLYGFSHQPAAGVRGRVALPLAQVTRVERRVKDDRAYGFVAAAAILAAILAARP